MEIKVTVDKQKLKVATNLKTFVSGTQNFIKFTFNFVDNIWKDLNTFVQFTQGDIAYNQDLDENGSVYLPSDIISGDCFITLYGATENVIAVTDSLKIVLKDNQLVQNIEDVKLSYSFYDQLVSGIRIQNLNTTSRTLVGAINELYSEMNDLKNLVSSLS